jgi:hypothetical protein
MANIQETLPEALEERAKTVTAKDGIYLEIASRALQGILANPLLLVDRKDTDPADMPKVVAVRACDYTEALIKEAKSRIAGCKGDRFYE